jgi:hypothetical protein
MQIGIACRQIAEIAERFLNPKQVGGKSHPLWIFASKRKVFEEKRTEKNRKGETKIRFKL